MNAAAKRGLAPTPSPQRGDSHVGVGRKGTFSLCTDVPYPAVVAVFEVP